MNLYCGFTILLIYFIIHKLFLFPLKIRKKFFESLNKEQYSIYWKIKKFRIFTSILIFLLFNILHYFFKCPDFSFINYNILYMSTISFLFAFVSL